MFNHNPTSRLECTQSGNHVSMNFAGTTIYFDADGIELPPLNDWTFALWMALPIAMTRSVDIESSIGFDAAAVENARRLIAMWSQWQPAKFQYVNIKVPETAAGPDKKSRGRLFFFSGGLDSMSMLVRKRTFAKEDAALTICGLDYRPDSTKFDALLGKTQSVLEHFGLNRIVVTTDAAKVVGDLKINHGFVLAALGFLFASNFESCHLAADAKIDSEFLVFPWGTNSVSNALFKSSRCRLLTEDLDEGRTDKIARLNAHPQLLEHASFCSDSRHRPNNCGVCGKCIRTKVRFYVLSGKVPPIFEINDFSDLDIERLDFTDKVIFQSMMALFIESGPDYNNKTVQLIGRLLEKRLKIIRRKSNMARIARHLSFRR